jgi:uncharacterized protein
MPRKFTEIAFTPAVKALQIRNGSRASYARFETTGPDNNRVTPEIAAFIQERDSFYLGTVSANGYPYIQFRGGATGFLKVLDDATLGFADFKGNAQYITTGNLAGNDKAFLFLMDYAHQRRLKIWGRATVVDEHSALLERLRVPNYEAVIERMILFHIEAWNWNCPQHIPIRYSQQEVDALIAPLQAKIAELEKKLNIPLPLP